MATKVWVGGTSTLEGDVNTAANWSPAVVPIATDDVYFDSSSTQAVTTSLSALSAINLGSVTIDCTYAIGTVDADLELQTDECYIKKATTAVYLDFGSTTAVTITQDAGSNVNVIAAHASGVVNQNGGVMNLGVPVGQAATFATINKRAGTLTVGDDATLTTVNSDAGSTTLKSGGTTLNILKGSVTTEGSGTWTTINIDDTGILYPNSTGTVTTTNIDSGGGLNATKSVASRTFTTVNLNGPGFVEYDDSYVTISTLATASYAKPTKLTVTQS
jgi:hypothetical protein